MKLKKLNFSFILFIIAATLSACSPLVKITYKDGKYIDKYNGVTYYAAGASYEPISVGAEYAQYKSAVLHTIGSLDPKQWLAEAFDGIGSVFYSSDISLPDLTEFEPVGILICIADNLIMNTGTVSDINDVKAVVSAMADETTENAVLPADGKRAYHLKFISEKYPDIYYNLIYAEGKDGTDYIYDRDTKRCITAGDLLKEYFISAEDISAGQNGGVN